MPLTPAEPTSALEIVMTPDPEDRLEPDLIKTLPPSPFHEDPELRTTPPPAPWLNVDCPALTHTLPPSPVFPLPTVTLTEPPTPPVATPD